MVRIAPVRLAFNPKTLWFDAADLPLMPGQDVVVSTVRGLEYGTVDKPVFEMSYEETKKLKSPLKPVKRVATDEDAERLAEVTRLSEEALPIFRHMVAESAPDMSPVAVEYLFGDDKAVFYFESEERVDFRDLVRKLAAEFHVRVDMKQIGVRDGARMVGGYGHCGQELCCRRLGGEFNSVSIRMAKEQDLSLNPQKISGVCGRLMCCLRYEYDAYKDFHGRAPKKNARIATPDGEGKVVDLDVPREIVSIKVGDEKPVKVPLADMDAPEEGARPTSVGQEAWDAATAPPETEFSSASLLFSNEFTGEDKLAEPGSVRHVHGTGGKAKAKAKGAGGAEAGKQRSRRRRGQGGGADAGTGAQAAQGSQRRARRSTTVKSDGSVQVQERKQDAAKAPAKAAAKTGEAPAGQGTSRSGRRRRARKAAATAAPQGTPQAQGTAQGAAAGQKQRGASQVGRNSSALRANRPAEGQDAGNAAGAGAGAAGADAPTGGQRRKRRSHRTGEAPSGQDSE